MSGYDSFLNAFNSVYGTRLRNQQIEQQNQAAQAAAQRQQQLDEQALADKVWERNFKQQVQDSQQLNQALTHFTALRDSGMSTQAAGDASGLSQLAPDRVRTAVMADYLANQAALDNDTSQRSANAPATATPAAPDATSLIGGAVGAAAQMASNAPPSASATPSFGPFGVPLQLPTDQPAASLIGGAVGVPLQLPTDQPAASLIGGAVGVPLQLPTDQPDTSQADASSGATAPSFSAQYATPRQTVDMSTAISPKLFQAQLDARRKEDFGNQQEMLKTGLLQQAQASRDAEAAQKLQLIQAQVAHYDAQNKDMLARTQLALDKFKADQAAALVERADALAQEVQRQKENQQWLSVAQQNANTSRINALGGPGTSTQNDLYKTVNQALTRMGPVRTQLQDQLDRFQNQSTQAILDMKSRNATSQAAGQINFELLLNKTAGLFKTPGFQTIYGVPDLVQNAQLNNNSWQGGGTVNLDPYYTQAAKDFLTKGILPTNSPYQNMAKKLNSLTGLAAAKPDGSYNLAMPGVTGPPPRRTAPPAKKPAQPSVQVDGNTGSVDGIPITIE